MTFEDPKKLIEQGYWQIDDLEPIALGAMTYQYLVNTINMIENGRILGRDWALPYLKDEQHKRLQKQKKLS